MIKVSSVNIVIVWKTFNNETLTYNMYMLFWMRSKVYNTPVWGHGPNMVGKASKINRGSEFSYIPSAWLIKDNSYAISIQLYVFYIFLRFFKDACLILFMHCIYGAPIFMLRIWTNLTSNRLLTTYNIYINVLCWFYYNGFTNVQLEPP